MTSNKTKTKTKTKDKDAVNVALTSSVNTAAATACVREYENITKSERQHGAESRKRLARVLCQKLGTKPLDDATLGFLREAFRRHAVAEKLYAGENSLKVSASRFITSVKARTKTVEAIDALINHPKNKRQRCGADDVRRMEVKLAKGDSVSAAVAEAIRYVTGEAFGSNKPKGKGDAKKAAKRLLTQLAKLPYMGADFRAAIVRLATAEGIELDTKAGK